VWASGGTRCGRCGSRRHEWDEEGRPQAAADRHLQRMDNGEHCGQAHLHRAVGTGSRVSKLLAPRNPHIFFSWGFSVGSVPHPWGSPGCPGDRFDAHRIRFILPAHGKHCALVCTRLADSHTGCHNPCRTANAAPKLVKAPKRRAAATPLSK
jgi:hypothetical protein